MNDEFLYRLRAKPSPEFAERLKKKLDRQAAAAASRKRSLQWCAAVGVVLCGTSFAVMSPTMRSFAVTVLSFFGGSDPTSVAIELDKGSTRPERDPSGNNLRSELWRDQRIPPPARTVSQAVESATSEANADPTVTESIPGATGTRNPQNAGAPTFAPSGAMRDSIRILSASRTYPLTLAVAERFGSSGSFKTPQVLHAGRHAFGLFCNGVGTQHADIADATRRMNSSDIERCFRSGVRDIVEIKIGYLAVTLARSNTATALRLAPRDIYLALAERIPDPAHPQGASMNPYATWRQVNPALPDEPIQVLGPAPGSELHRMFAEFVLDTGCATFASMNELAKTDPDRYRHLCHSLRQDGPYVDAGENEALILQQIVTNPGAVGLFSYNFLRAHRDELTASALDGFDPAPENVTSGKYPASRALYMYVKKAHLTLVPGMRSFVGVYVNERTTGPTGFLVDRGLIPLPVAERTAMRRHAEALRTLQPEDSRRQR